MKQNLTFWLTIIYNLWQAYACKFLSFLRDLIKPKCEKADHTYKEIPKNEVIRRLREKGEPIKLFAETHEETCQRLRLVEMTSADDDKGLFFYIQLFKSICNNILFLIK